MCQKKKQNCEIKFYTLFTCRFWDFGKISTQLLAANSLEKNNNNRRMTLAESLSHAIFTSEVPAKRKTSSVSCACFLPGWAVLFQTAEHPQWFLETVALLKHLYCQIQSTCSPSEVIHPTEDIHTSYIRVLFNDADCSSVIERISRQTLLHLEPHSWVINAQWKTTVIFTAVRNEAEEE